MKEEVLEAIIKKASEYCTGICTIVFQGGEPTLRGLEFFKENNFLVGISLDGNEFHHRFFGA